MRAVTVGIISIGDMGLGMSRLLKAHGYRVVTSVEGRSEHTLSRVRAADIEPLSDQELVVQTDYVLSIVPPRDALATAERITRSCREADTATKRNAIERVNGGSSRGPLYYLELNATSPRLVEEIAAMFDTESFVPCQFLDGGIIGGPPSQTLQEWKKPSVVLSGTVDLPPTFSQLTEVLNLKLVSPRIGAASTLKLSFAALTKGLTALSILSFSTAQKQDLLPELLEHLQQYSPHTAALASAGVIGMSPKAYRWVDEMRGIGEAIDREGAWGGLGSSVYGGFADVYRSVSDDTVLGLERVEARSRGKTVEDAANIIAESKK
ncbi:Dehydrogenase multihelical [Penicillium taxi]|uniref:Dehydrogenase multihelical n=1 Tax=Penicillium taxi TaxID=168475 RepID=UPI0025453430|nr:Dehydrogenase multihelical [Penicillium taxi]KAJ5888295.1 Dehydrogenase multihelical [Penicillium taxi]